MVLFAVLMPVVVLVVIGLIYGGTGQENGMIGTIFEIGLVIASTARDIKRAGMIASLVYFPMLIFSGTTVPFPVFPEFVQRAAVILPLRHGIELLNAASFGTSLGSMWPRILLLLGISIGGVIVSIRTFRWDME